MKLLRHLIIAFISITLAHAEEALDWNKLAKNITGQWSSASVTARPELPAGFPIPKLSIKVNIRADGTARMETNIEGEAPSDSEFHYCLGKDVITFYDPKTKESGDGRLYAWRMNGDTLELDTLGGAPVTVHFKKAQAAP